MITDQTLQRFILVEREMENIKDDIQYLMNDAGKDDLYSEIRDVKYDLQENIDSLEREHENKIENLENELDGIEAKINNINDRIISVSLRIEEVNKTLIELFDKLVTSVDRITTVLETKNDFRA